MSVRQSQKTVRNLNYFSNAYAAAVSAVDPDAGNGELCIKVPSELWKHVDGKAPRTIDCKLKS
ncbi:Transcription initiation factor TFIID subunit 2, partial [Saguinus oedipus]